RMSERLGHVYRSGEHLLRLINDILDLSRIESGRLSFSSERVALSSALTEVISQLEPQAARQRISIGRESTPDDDAIVVAELTGGSNGFTSEPGRGSEFWIELPEPEAEKERPANAVPRANRALTLHREGTSYVLVYIEDNPSNIALMQALIDDLPRMTMLA